MIRSKSIVGLLMAGLLTFSVIPVCGCAQESNTAKADSAGAAATTAATDNSGTASDNWMAFCCGQAGFVL